MPSTAGGVEDVLLALSEDDGATRGTTQGAALGDRAAGSASQGSALGTTGAHSVDERLLALSDDSGCRGTDTRPCSRPRFSGDTASREVPAGKPRKLARQWVKRLRQGAHGAARSTQELRGVVFGAWSMGRVRSGERLRTRLPPLQTRKRRHSNTWLTAGVLKSGVQGHL